MKENKKIDVKDLYYATLIDEYNKIDYVIGTYKKCVFTNIKTDDKYVHQKDIMLTALVRDGRFITNNIDLIGVTPYTSIVSDAFGKKTVKEILDKDKFISKTLNYEIYEYCFNDTQEVQNTLAIIKPDGIKNSPKIMEMIYKSGLKIKEYEVRMLDEEVLAEHYSHLLDKPFYPKLKEYMLSGEVVLMILEGENAVEKLRELMGPTDSTKAPKGTIRGEFGTDITYNAIHGSDSKESAKLEINRFFKQKQKRI